MLYHGTAPRRTQGVVIPPPVLQTRPHNVEHRSVRAFQVSSPATPASVRGPVRLDEESNMYESTQPRTLGMVDRGQFSRFQTLKALQEGEVFVYAVLTKEGAIKVGSTTDLAERLRGIRFGGPKKIMGFIPGDLRMERDVQASLAEHLIPGTREYFYPRKPVLAKANWMRAYWGIEPLPTHYLPRLAECTFHRRVSEALARGESVFG